MKVEALAGHIVFTTTMAPEMPIVGSAYNMSVTRGNGSYYVHVGRDLDNMIVYASCLDALDTGTPTSVTVVGPPTIDAATRGRVYTVSVAPRRAGTVVRFTANYLQDMPDRVTPTIDERIRRQSGKSTENYSAEFQPEEVKPGRFFAFARKP